MTIYEAMTLAWAVEIDEMREWCALPPTSLHWCYWANWYSGDIVWC